MKFLLKHIVIIICLVSASCSTVVENLNRMPAEASNIALDKVFSFKAAEKKPSVNKDANEKKAKETIEQWINQSHFTQTPKKVEYLPVSSLQDGALFKLELDVDSKDSKLVFRIFHTADAFNDKTTTVAMTEFIQTLMNKTVFGNIHSVFEAYYNAKHGDPISTLNLLSIRMSEPTFSNEDDLKLFESDEFNKLKLDLEKVKESLKVEIKALSAQRKISDKKRKIGLDALDKAQGEKQFRDLIAKGDRKGAGALLKRYLPWEDMPPFEKKFWETYLAVMEKPVPIEQRILIYRGIDDDYINRAHVAGKELTEKEAVLQNKAFVMSSGMVKNQGTWNRRLRTLEAMNSKFIATINGEDDFAQSARVTTMFLNHSDDPKGSPFISFTPNIEIADGFGSSKISAYLIDPRLLSFNYASSFDNEIEFLLPITTFPDELVAIFHHEYNPVDFLERKKAFNEKLDQLVVKIYGKDKAPAIITQIKKNTYQFFKLHYTETKDTPGKNPASANKAFYKTFLDANDPKPVLTPDGDLTCKNLIKLFWLVK